MVGLRMIFISFFKVLFFFKDEHVLYLELEKSINTTFKGNKDLEPGYR